MHQKFLAVGIDVGSQVHRIAVMNPQGKIIDQWSTKHRYADFKQAARRMQALSREYNLPLIVGIEGYNGHQIAKVIYKLMSSNSLYLPSYKKAA